MSGVQYEAGEEIFAEGDPAEDAFVIDSGQVEIVKEVDGAPVVLARLTEGEIFGEMGLLDDKPRSAGARAATDVTLQCMSHEHFMYVLLHKPEQSIGYLKKLFERLRVANTKVAAEDLLTPTPATDDAIPIHIHPASDEARRYLPAEGQPIVRLPFRFGRVHPDPFTTNDLTVVDQTPYSVSRHHFLIDRAAEGFVVRDRGSYLGTIVNGETIGGKRTRGEAPLQSGTNTVVVGSEESPFRLEFVVA